MRETRESWSEPRRLTDCHSIADLRLLAKRRLPRPIFHYLDGAAEDEFTAFRNTAAFDDRSIIPRCLVDVSAVTTRTQVLGQWLEWPMICSPTGSSRFFHPDGELAAARAASNEGAMYGLSTMSTHSLEDVAAASPGAKLYQLYVFKDRTITRNLIERCKQARYAALCLTVDTPVPGNRERDLRTGWGVPIKLSARSLLSFARHPWWLADQTRRGVVSMPTIADLCGSTNLITQATYISNQFDPTVAWDDVAEMVELWGGPFAIKGIMSPLDARRALDIGATAIIVSNHGGRQLDSAVSPFEVLPSILDAVGNRIEVILDGGIRRGVHLLKALALGATACSIGRPYLYGLSAGGQDGVERALKLLRSEFVRAMQLSGCADIGRLDEAILSAQPALRPATLGSRSD